MSDKDDEIEWTVLEDGVEQEPEPEDEPVIQHDSDGPDLFERSYIDDGGGKKPSMILVGIIILLIVFVFWKKIVGGYAQKSQPQVEQPVDNKTQ